MIAFYWNWMGFQDPCEMCLEVSGIMKSLSATEWFYYGNLYLVTTLNTFKSRSTIHMTWILAFGMSHTSLQNLSLTTGFTQEGVLLSNPSWNIDTKKKKSAFSSFWCSHSDCYCCLTIYNGATSIFCIQKQPQTQILPNSRACVCALCKQFA